MATLPANLDLSTLTTSASLFAPHTHTPSPAPPFSPPLPPSHTPSPLHSQQQQKHPKPSPTPPTPAATPSSAVYTLPQIRAVHAALLSRASDLQTRLRTRVGGSYRELLGTADEIAGMRGSMEEVLGTLGGMGGRCGRGVVGGKVEGLGGFVGEFGYGGDVGGQARGRLLEGVGVGLGGVLKGGDKKGRGEGLVLAARLYVLGRLLVKSFGEGGGGKEVAAARRGLETVHQARLARGIDAVLRSGSEKAMREGHVVKALSAYSLATSSGARDVLAHFLRVRAKAIAMALEVDAEERPATARNPKDVLRALGLYTKTILDVQALVPHKLTEALVALKEERLLENAALKEMEGLRLDVYGRWCGDEIHFYKPFIRHDDLDLKQAREMLADFADKGSDVLLHGLEKTLEGMTEFKAIVELRTSVLRLWIAEGGKARGFDPSEMLDRLRAAINTHMLRVLEAKVTKLRLVGSEVSAALDAWREGATDKHHALWDVSSLDTELTHGAAPFAQDVVARLHGRGDAVSKAVAGYRSWFRVIDDVGQVVDQLRRQRWDNDVDEIEDEETIEERQRLLARDDPSALGAHLDRLLVDAFRRLDDQLSTLWKSRRASPNSGAVATYFLRLLRDVRARLPELDNPAVRGFGLDSVPSLHEALAGAVVVAPLDEFVTGALARRTVVGRGLWEGAEPALPGFPSPGAFRFLRALAVAMGDAGGDLWSPAAVAVLKGLLARQVAEAWVEVLGSLEGQEEEKDKEDEDEDEEESGDEGEKEKGEKEGKEKGKEEKGEKEAKASSTSGHQDLLIQWLMDVNYLQLFLGSDNDGLKGLTDAVYQKSGLDTASKERLGKAAQDYFKRTSLLFSLLA